MSPEDEAEEDGANVDLDSQRKGKCVVLKTSTRQVSAAHPNLKMSEILNARHLHSRCEHLMLLLSFAGFLFRMEF